MNISSNKHQPVCDVDKLSIEEEGDSHEHEISSTQTDLESKGIKPLDT
jgi:hypothetical protein